MKGRSALNRRELIRAADGTGSGSRSSRSEFNTTRMLEPAMIAAASAGCSHPSIARVTAMQL